jgi:NTE family protein
MKKENVKRALCLGGGGSLGAYEMGVWKALRKLNISFSIVTGTSIGALIGAFVVANKYRECQKLWKNIHPNKIVKDGLGLNFDFNDMRKTFLKDRHKIVELTKEYIKNKGLDISPFVELINRSISAEEIKQSSITFGVVATSLILLKQINVKINEVPDNQVHDWLHASSAIWPFFPPRKINNQYYIDGGIRDNVPIKFAFELGAEEVIAVNLFYKINWHPILNKRDDVINIEPSWPLGHMFNFNQKEVDNIKKLGYNDTMKLYGYHRGFRYTFYKNKQFDKYDDIFQQKLRLMFPYRKTQINKMIKQHTRSIKLQQGDVFIRAVEILAESLKINHTNIYHLHQLIQLCYAKITPHFDTSVIVQLLKKIRDKKKITYQDEKNALGALKYAFTHSVHKDDVPKMIGNKTKHLIIYLLLSIIHQYNLDEKKSHKRIKS